MAVLAAIPSLQMPVVMLTRGSLVVTRAAGRGLREHQGIEKNIAQYIWFVGYPLALRWMEKDGGDFVQSVCDGTINLPGQAYHSYSIALITISH